MSNLISIVIATKNYSTTLFKTLESINRQIYLPREVIIVSNIRIHQKINLNKKIILKKFTSKIQNQVSQRNIAIQNISRDSDIILQLDDRIILDKLCLNELNHFWNKTDKFVIGVGLNQINSFKDRGLFNKFLYYFNLKGKVLRNGFSIDYSNIKKDIEVMWLKGGLSSWKIKKNLNIKNRKFPIQKWSVYEDVDYCLKKNVNQRLMVSHKAKAKVIERKNTIYVNDLLYRGSIYTYSQKRIVKKFFKTTFFFYLTVPLLVFMSLTMSILTLNFSKIIYNLGRLKGFYKINFN